MQDDPNPLLIPSATDKTYFELEHYRKVIPWEYEVIYRHTDISIHDLKRGLNKYGDEGWELVGIDKDYFFFKRQGGNLE